MKFTSECTKKLFPSINHYLKKREGYLWSVSFMVLVLSTTELPEESIWGIKEAPLKCLWTFKVWSSTRLLRRDQKLGRYSLIQQYVGDRLLQKIWQFLKEEKKLLQRRQKLVDKVGRMRMDSPLTKIFGWGYRHSSDFILLWHQETLLFSYSEDTVWINRTRLFV